MAARKPVEKPVEPEKPAEPEALTAEEVAAKPKPTNIIEAIARVELEIGGIKKLTPEQRRRISGAPAESGGVTFAYRGIDQIAAAAQQLFGDYGVVIVPSVRDESIEPIVKGSATRETTQWTRTNVKVEWAMYGPGGVDDCIRSITVGVGDDNADKGMNKAMTAAFKNLLLRILCIGDPADDTDAYQAAFHQQDDQPRQTAAQRRGAQVEEVVELSPGQLLFADVRAVAGDPRYTAALKAASELAGVKLTERTLVENEAFRLTIAGVMQATKAEIDRVEAEVDAQDAAAEEPHDLDPPVGPVEAEGILADAEDQP